MTRLQEIHDLKVEQIAREYQSQGYQVDRAPSDPALLAVLGDYQPDLVATRGEEHIAVEIKTGAERLSPERFQDIAGRLRERPGWRLLLVSASAETASDEMLAAANLSSREELRDRLDRARLLWETGEDEAAFLLCWSALEGLVRRHLQDRGSPLDRLALVALLKHLYSQGEISAEQLEQLLDLYETRNRLVHGLQPTEAQDLSPRAERILTLAEELEQNWRSLH